MERKHIQPNKTHNAAFTASNVYAERQQQGAPPEARPVPPLANAGDLSTNPSARNVQTYNVIRTARGATEHLAADAWNAPEYQPIQPGLPYMEKLAAEAANTKKVGMLVKHAQEYEAKGELQDAEEAYEKALKYTDNAEHYKLYAGCLKEISASLLLKSPSKGKYLD